MARSISKTMERLLTVSDLAALLGMSPSTIYNRRYYGGDLPPSYDIGGGRVQSVEAEVLDWLKGRRENDQVSP